MNTLPKIADLYQDIEQVAKLDQLNALLNQQPKDEWVKAHPYVKGWKYLPIDKIEWLLQRIFKSYRIEITGQGTAFNGVWVTVRIHYQNPTNGEWNFHDGIGAQQLQTKAGSSPVEMQNINNGALSMSFPIAKSLAIKDACDHFGRLFGSDLNRKDLAPVGMDMNLQDKAIERKQLIQQTYEQVKSQTNE
ncbi:MAG TPA: hypothetical protein PLY25_11045 [Bacteroidia bacterium]|nr:hypothetical protein [Saprospiraceae bacterium]HRC16207.1 hypothetical protein [Bacteroidia bacterium]